MKRKSIVSYIQRESGENPLFYLALYFKTIKIENMKAYDAETEKLITQAKENRLKDPRLVLEAARRLRDIAKSSNDKSLLGFADYSMTNAYFILNDAVSVKHYAERALPNLKTAEEWYYVGSTYNILGLMQNRLGNMAMALDYLTTAMSYTEEHHVYDLCALLYLNAADVCVQLEDKESALHNILAAETYLDRTSEGEQRTYIYLIASSEAVTYAKMLNQLDVYEKQKVILQALLKENPEYKNEPGVLLLEYQEAYENNDTEREQQLIEQIKKSLFDSPEFLNYANEILNFLAILKNMKRYDLLDEVLDHTVKSLNGFQASGIMARLSSFKLQYYEDTGRKEEFMQELYDYWEHSKVFRKQTNQAILSLIKTQHSLKDSERTNERLKELAGTDSLTSLPNRRSLNEKFDQMFELCYHAKHCFGVAMLDVDNFKGVNDTYGHSTGDDVLVLIGKCMKEISGQTIYTARYGGDEFVILFDDAGDSRIKDTIQLLKQKLTKGIQDSSLPAFTITCGIYTKVPQTGAKVWDYSSASDAALYSAKANGRNQVCLIHAIEELPHTN